MDKCPITGLPCPHNKIIHVTEVANYQATEVRDMCALCGVQYITIEGGPTFNPTANQVFQVINTIIKDPETQKGKIVLTPFQPSAGCPACQHSLEEILMTGKLGCGHCYEHYKKELLPLIEKCQSGGLKHLGKIPKNLPPKKPSPELLKKLENDLKVAIDKEDYEQAAKLKDEIKKLQCLF